MSVPVTQKAVIFGRTGNSDQTVRIEFDYPVPTPGQGELLIQNTLCGVNNADTYYRAGFYNYKASSPTVLGHEAVGIVSALGPGTKWSNFKVGDRVIWVHKGAYAQYSAVPVENTLKIPKGILDHDAIAGFLNGMTALALVKEVYKVNKGEWVLLHAAESNIGLLMVQILKSLGAKIIGTVDTTTKIGLVKSLGADAVINYTDYIKSGWPHRVKEITKSDGPSVVYDFVGKDTWKGSLDAVKGNGTILWCGTLSGPIPPMSQSLLSPKNIKIIYPSPASCMEKRDVFERHADDLFGLIKSGRLKVRAHNVYFLEDFGQAHSDLKARRTGGKILLRP